MIYRIKDWDVHFENNRSREMKELRFIILPNKHDGDGYTELIGHPNGAAHYGAWVAIVQVASRGNHPAGRCGIPAGCCECRGMLLRDGAKPHSPDSLSRITRLPAEIFSAVIPRLIEIGWIEEVQLDEDLSTIPHRPADITSQSRTVLRESDTEWNGMEWNGTEEKGIEHQQRASRTLVAQGTRLPEGFEISEELRTWAATKAPHVDLSTALDEFHDYWRGVPGTRGKKLDWEGTFRNRLRELEGRSAKSGRLSRVDGSMAAVGRVIEGIRCQKTTKK